MLSIDGVHIENDLGLHLLADSSEPGLPSTRDSSVMIPRLHGAYALDSYMQPRTFFQRILIPSQATLDDVQKVIRKVSTMLLDQYGKPKEVELRWDYEPEKYYKAKFSGYISVNRIAKTGLFPIPFTAYDPYAYAPATYYDPDFIANYNREAKYNSGIEYKNQTHTPFVNTRQYAGVYNYSHYATPFSFVIEGYVEHPKITNQATGQSMQLNINVLADERLYVDSKIKTTWKVKISEDKYLWATPNQTMQNYATWDNLNKYNDMSGQFIELVAGGNSFLFEGGSPNAEVNFKWEHRFM